MAKLQQHNNAAFFSCSNNVQLINPAKSPYHSWFKSGRSFDDQIIRQHQKTCHTKEAVVQEKLCRFTELKLVSVLWRQMVFARHTACLHACVTLKASGTENIQSFPVEGVGVEKNKRSGGRLCSRQGSVTNVVDSEDESRLHSQHWPTV
ncbi:hypothetical protein T10_8336 [Trichinella papuae]|uniref:Uncharacterized protein n=1 Tax=Trichinella papuae TaxID=268474 RepID=A0A0V1N4T6_9BILA|nr:hypothetical protein T10_8336 [Trichinella papuae]